MVKKSALIALFAVLGLVELKAQDPHFSQYYANPLYLNPAFAGVKRCPKVNLNYRNQYPTMGVYQTYSASYDQYISSLKGGIGVLVMRDEAADGALSLTEASLIYSYHLQVSRKFQILTGFQATFRQRALDWNSLKFPDQIDPFYGFVKPTNEIAPNQTTTNQLDLTFGILGFTEKFYFGVTGSHVTEPNEAFLSNNELPFKLTAMAGASIPVGSRRLHNSTRSYLIPNVVYQQQAGARQMTLGLSFNRGIITGGLGYRQAFSSITNNPDALVFTLGLTPGNQPWTFGYSYDYTINQLKNNLGGAHEISLSYQFPCRIRKKQIQEIKCPKF